MNKEKNRALKTDFETVKMRYLNALWNGLPDDDKVNEITSKLKQKGNTLYFSDVDYESLSASAWNTVKHLKKLSLLITAYGKDKIENDKEVSETLMSILDYWLCNDFTCSVNWWYNEIDIPRYMADIGIRLKNLLNEKQKEKMNEIIGRGTLKGNEKAALYTGANLTDMMYSTILQGVFSDDCDLILSAVDRVAEEIRISKGDSEGIQNDGSYFQHGNLLCCAGSYGTVFIEGIRSFITALYGTKFSLPEEKIKIFIDNILNGHRYFHRGLGTAYFSIGRSAIYADGAWQLLLSASELSKLSGIYRGDELKAYAESFSDFSLVPEKNKYFPYAYTLTHISPNCFMGVRGAHENIVLTEVINRQNLLGYNLSYGSNT